MMRAHVAPPGFRVCFLCGWTAQFSSQREQPCYTHYHRKNTQIRHIARGVGSGAPRHGLITRRLPPLEAARSIVPAAAGRKRTCKGHTISAREQPRRMRGEAAAQLRAYPDRSSRKKKKSLAALERGGRAGWRRGRGKGSLRSPAEDCVRLLRLCPRVCPKAVRLVVLKAGDLNLLTRQELLSSQSCATGCPPGLQSRPCLA